MGWDDHVTILLNGLKPRANADGLPYPQALSRTRELFAIGDIVALEFDPPRTNWRAEEVPAWVWVIRADGTHILGNRTLLFTGWFLFQKEDYTLRYGEVMAKASEDGEYTYEVELKSLIGT